MTLTKKTKNIIKLVLSCVLAVAGIICIIIASVNGANKYKGIEYSHNITIENIRTDNTSGDIVYYYVTLNGGVRNCTDEEVENIYVVIVFDGVDNNTGERNEERAALVLSGAKSNQTVVLKEDEIKVGNRRGFIPETIKKVEIVKADGSTYKAVYMEESDANIIVFALGFVAIALGGLLFVNWLTEYKKLKGNMIEKKEVNQKNK